MSLLHEPSIARVEGGRIGGDGMVQLFETLAADAQLNEVPVMTLMVPYVDDADVYETGTYIPELQLVVRRVDDD
jgi:hypothetical protein